jgi:hypothetical protein
MRTDALNGNAFDPTVTADDLLAAIAFQAQRISAAAAHTAAGAPFPDPASIQAAIDRMTQLNARLAVVVRAAQAAQMLGSVQMTAELSN